LLLRSIFFFSENAESKPFFRRSVSRVISFPFCPHKKDGTIFLTFKTIFRPFYPLKNLVKQSSGYWLKCKQIAIAEMATFAGKKQRPLICKEKSTY